jgi:hypothetical protein
LIFEYDKLVIGSCLEAVLYAFNNRYPIFFTTPQRPFRFDHLNASMDLSCLKIPGTVETLTTFNEEKKIGITKEILWERMLFLLAMDGKVPLSDMCSRIRYDGETAVCSNEYSKIFEMRFGECYYYGDPFTTGFVKQKALDEHTYMCYDYIAFNKGGKHEIDYLHTGDDFVSEIWFYPSDRIDGDTPVRDACAVSKLTEQQLLDFDYSQTMARFKLIHEMESRGMKGTFAHGFTSAGNPKHYKFRTSSISRETRKRRNEEEPETSIIKIAPSNEARLLGDISNASVAYDRFLRHW